MSALGALVPVAAQAALLLVLLRLLLLRRNGHEPMAHDLAVADADAAPVSARRALLDPACRTRPHVSHMLRLPLGVTRLGSAHHATARVAPFIPRGRRAPRP